MAVGGLLATKVASASKSDEMLADAASVVGGKADRGTLTHADRRALAAPDADDTVAIPLASASVRPAPDADRHAAVAVQKRATAPARKAVVVPKKITPPKPAAPPAKLAAACQQRDPIARLLASVNLGTRCAG
jgi:hypothetical protein